MFFIGTALAMLADNTEHVISYWVIFQKFHSAELGGFAVISHWVPYLAFSVYAGSLGDRVDPRRIIQVGMVLFMGVSVAWGMLFLTDSLQAWHARLLLIIHGTAGVLWAPPSQLLLHDIVEIEQLPSAVRLTATARYLGMLTGPAVGGALLLAFGPAHGILINASIYLPMFLWLFWAPHAPRSAAGAAVRGLRDLARAFRSIRSSSTVLGMTLLAGCAAALIGNAYQAQMPAFAVDLGHGDPGMAYSMLLAADAGGALTAGFALEKYRWLPLAPRTALLLAMAWCCALAAFALTRIYPLALALLFIAGFVELSFNSMAQALVQLGAPADVRGRIIGVFTMAGSGMRTFSGVTVGIVGGLIGIRGSLAASAGVLLLMIAVLLALNDRRARAAQNA